MVVALLSVEVQKAFGICVPKMYEGLMDLERQEGEYLMTEFLGDLTL